MMNSRGLSVIAPSYNQGRYIRKMIESVLTQSYEPFELIVVDGGSTDDTVEILRSYADRPQVRWVSERDNGPVDAVNKGLRLARYDIETIISTDDYFLPRAFEQSMQMFDQNPDAGLIYGEYARVLDSGELIPVPSGSYSTCHLLSGITFVPQGASFFRKTLADQLGGWDERIPYVPDTDFWFRMSLTSPVIKAKYVWIASHVHAEQRTNQRAKVLRDYRLMIEQMEELKQAPSRVRRAALAGLCRMNIRFGVGLTDLEMTKEYWKSIALYPHLFFSSPKHRLVPGYFYLAAAAGKLRRFVGWVLETQRETEMTGSSKVLNPLRGLAYISRKIMGTIYRFNVVNKSLAITFDDGPDPDDTPAVLDILRFYRAKATFFMVGEAVLAYPAMYRRVADEGHTIGNHTFSHASMPCTSWSQRGIEVQQCQEAIRQYGRKYFRMPFGHQNVVSHLQVMQQGLRVFGWTHKADDTRGLHSAEMIRRLDGVLTPGDIVSFHDTVYHYRDACHRDRGEMHKALAHILEVYSKQGYEWANLETMMQTGSPQRTHWYRNGADVDFGTLTKKSVVR